MDVQPGERPSQVLRLQHRRRASVLRQLETWMCLSDDTQKPPANPVGASVEILQVAGAPAPYPLDIRTQTSPHPIATAIISALVLLCWLSQPGRPSSRPRAAPRTFGWRRTSRSATTIDPQMTFTQRVLAPLLLVLILGSAWWGYDHSQDAKYQRFCIDSLTDQARCDRGPAAEPRRRCEAGDWPPGVPSEGRRFRSEWVKAWLAHD